MLERGFNLGYHPFPDSLEFPDFANCVSKTLHKKLINPLDKLDLIMYIVYRNNKQRRFHYEERKDYRMGCP